MNTSFRASVNKTRQKSN